MVNGRIGIIAEDIAPLAPLPAEVMLGVLCEKLVQRGALTLDDVKDVFGTLSAKAEEIRLINKNGDEI